MVNKKDYLSWHKIKFDINSQKERPHFHAREIWFCSLGFNIGFEQDGSGSDYLRPVIILKKFNKEVCLIVPLTKNKKNGIHYFSFSYIDEIESTAILSQIRLIDSKRLKYLSGYISENSFKMLKEKLKLLIA